MDFIEQPRQVTFYWHVWQVNNWLRFDNGRHLGNVLAYVAYELRCAIERCLFELLFFMKECKFTTEEQKKCRTWDGLNSLMNETSPSYKEYQKHVAFTNIATKVMGMQVPQVIPVNIAFLRDSWQRVSNYCHKHLVPEETFDNKEWVENGFAEISKTLAEFERINKGSFGLGRKSSMPQEVRDLYNDFLGDKIDEGQVERSLIIMEPILAKRKYLKGLV